MPKHLTKVLALTRLLQDLNFAFWTCWFVSDHFILCTYTSWHSTVLSIPLKKKSFIFASVFEQLVGHLNTWKPSVCVLPLAIQICNTAKPTLLISVVMWGLFQWNQSIVSGSGIRLNEMRLLQKNQKCHQRLCHQTADSLLLATSALLVQQTQNSI